MILKLIAYHNLKFLDFCGCKKLTDDNVVELCKNFPELTYLNLVKNKSLISIDMVCITD